MKILYYRYRKADRNILRGFPKLLQIDFSNQWKTGIRSAKTPNLLFRQAGREYQPECASSVKLTIHFDPPAMLLHDLVYKI